MTKKTKKKNVYKTKAIFIRYGQKDKKNNTFNKTKAIFINIWTEKILK